MLSMQFKSIATTSRDATPEPASPPNEGFLIDLNLFDYQPQVLPVPIELLSNLQRDQLRSVFELEQRVYDV